MTTPLRSGHLAAIYDILDFLGSLKDADEDALWSRIVEKLSVAFDCEAATYYSFLNSKRQLLPRYSLGARAKDMHGTAVDIRTGICGWVATHREPSLVEDAYEDKRFLREVDQVTGFRTKTVLAVPLLDRMELLGVIQFLNKRAGPFNAEDLRLVEAVARSAALGLRALRLESTVDKVASRNQSILESLGGGFMAIDTHGKIILCNPAAKRILDLPPDLPLNTPAEQALLHVPRLADVLLETLSSRKTVKRQDLPWASKGVSKLLGYSTILIQDTKGEITGAGISFQDITYLKH